jgi:DNA polymerase-3 subunit epsilon
LRCCVLQRYLYYHLLYAVVDIETTGGNAQYGGITEIAIILFNGKEIEGRFETLVNPEQHVPRYITALTGISDYMLADAPKFEEIAERIYILLKDRIFVAHNVNFDYSFIYHHLARCGYDWQAKKLCTVRYARKVLPGKSSYSLGNITRSLGIEIENRHRAGGDAMATVQLLQHLINNDVEQKHLASFIKGKNPNTYLPMNVAAEEFADIPYNPGVYYFHNKAGKIIYVGKAKNLKYRVRSHFSNNNPAQRKQEFVRNIHKITYTVCATELMAIVLEALEIKRLWPVYNRSQKRFEQLYALYTFEDQSGLMRLAVEKKRKHLPSLHSFHRVEEGFAIGRKLSTLFEMQEKMVFATSQAPLLTQEELQAHNLKMKAAVDHLKENLPSFGVIQSGFDEKGNEVKVGYLIEKGHFAGMGYLDASNEYSFEYFKDCMKQYHDYDFVRAALHNFAERYPTSVIKWNNK